MHKHSIRFDQCFLLPLQESDQLPWWQLAKSKFNNCEKHDVSVHCFQTASCVYQIDNHLDNQRSRAKTTVYVVMLFVVEVSIASNNSFMIYNFHISITALTLLTSLCTSMHSALCLFHPISVECLCQVLYPPPPSLNPLPLSKHVLLCFCFNS